MSERVKRAAVEMVVSGGEEGWREERECDEMMNFLAVGMLWLVSSCSEATLPPSGEKEPYRHIQLLTT